MDMQLLELLRAAPCQVLQPSVNADAQVLQRALRCDEFYHQAETAVLVKGTSGSGWAEPLFPLFAQHGIRDALGSGSGVSFCLRSGFSIRGARCALLLNGERTVCLLFSIRGAKPACEALKNFVAEISSASISVQLYRTPFQCTSAPRTDEFWGEHWTDRKSATSSDYDVYRLALDDLVEAAIREALRLG